MTKRPPISSKTLDRLCAVVGPSGAIREPNEMAAYLTEWRDRWTGTTPLILRPKSTQEVADIVKICAETNTAIVPQGGNTGLVGGQIPTDTEILLSLNRLNNIRAVDNLNNSMIVEAGCILTNVQQAAAEADRLFPMSLASEGSAQIGGLLSTNAGGIHVLRYGTMRELVLGLEVVTADGQVWNDLKALRKDNTGYNLRQLFLGAEGTLGIITAASLRLFPRPRDVETVFVAIPNVSAAVKLLSLANRLSGNLASAFELIPRLGLDFVTKHVNEARDPFDEDYPWYLVIEFSSGQAQGSLRPTVETFLETAFTDNLILNGVIAQSEQQAEALWLLRERLSEVQKFEGGSLKHDIAVPVSALPDFMTRALEKVAQIVPGIRPVPFGHIGDGNVHFNLSQPKDMNTDEFFTRRDEIAMAVHDIVQTLDGSFSAEHGVGVARLGDMARYKSALDLDLMHRLKNAFDPQGIMNPGKILEH